MVCTVLSMNVKCSEDVVPLADIEVNPGCVVKHAGITLVESALGDPAGVREWYAEEG